MISKEVGEFESPLSGARLPSLAALRCFEAAARLENFAQAAVELHVTPGAVSRAVRLLEDELNVELFKRRNRRVYLSDDGRRLSRAVGEGFGLIAQTVKALRAKTRRDRQLVLSCEPTLLMRWLIPRWGEFQMRHPDLDIHLVAGGGSFSFDHGIDLAIRRDDFPRPAHYHAEQLFLERIAPVCRPDRASEWFTTEGALRSEAPRLHTRTRPLAWQDWARVAGRSLPSSEGQSFEHFYFSLQAAIAGLGVAIGPWHLVQDDIRNGVLTAPSGFVEDGSRYCLLAPAALSPGSVEMDLLEWLRKAG